MTPDELGRLLDELGRRLGPGGEYVFRIAVQRVIVGSVVGAAVSAAFLVGFGIYLRAVIRSYRGYVPKEDGYISKDWLMDGLGMPLVLGALLGCIGAAVAVIALSEAVIRLLTPEYTALRDILSALGGVR